MANTLRYYRAPGFLPYRNQALEEYFLDMVPSNTCMLYLWQNRKTVVLGQNQNAWQECRVNKLEGEGGHVARRLSGGGAVFHDLGNLNFTFLAQSPVYDVNRQLEVILRACQSLGISAQRSGRNDITVEERKFSGNAFYSRGPRHYHHGTLLLHADFSQLAEYLTVPPQKLAAKGVSSVKARVANLREFCPELTVDQMADALVAAFGAVYGAPVQPFALPPQAEPVLQALTEKYSDWNWRVGKALPFDWQGSERFAWGGVQLQFTVKNGCVSEAAVYSDGLQPQPLLALPGVLQGCRLQGAELSAATLALISGYPEARQELGDIAALLQRQNY